MQQPLSALLTRYNNLICVLEVSFEAATRLGLPSTPLQPNHSQWSRAARLQRKIVCSYGLVIT
jgi:hypothetical protein